MPGVYGHNAVFEEVRQGLARRLSAEAAAQGAEALHFPPLLPRRHLEASGYLSSFPHLAGTVYSFVGDERAAREQGEWAGAHRDWGRHQEPTEVALVPAACYPVYPALAARGPLSAEGAMVDAGGGWVFRHEPSDDPGRRQVFHQHEIVRLGQPEAVYRWREEWARRGFDLLTSLGLDVDLDVATDPFFGRQGRMLAAQQRDQELKLELVLTLAGPEPLALASFNHHRDHFAVIFGLRGAGGAEVHTACLGFGHERIVLALLHEHGLRPDRWPSSVRSQLWP